MRSAPSPARNPTPPRSPALAEDLKALEDADPPLRRAQHQDVRGDPRHAAQDRRPAGLAGETDDAPAVRRAGGQARARWRCSDAPSIDPDDDMPLAGDLPIAEAAAARAPPRRRAERSPAEAAAEAAVAALGTDRRPRKPGRPRPLDVRRPLARASPGRSGTAAEPAMARAAMPACEAAQKLELDAAARSQARQPAARAGLRRARPQRDHAARARRARPAARNGETDAAKSDFIAAARRAAQAAAAEAEILKRNPDIAGPVRNMKLGDLFKSQAQADPDGRARPSWSRSPACSSARRS